MNSLKALFMALILAVSTPVIVMAEEHAAEKVAVTELTAAVKSGFTKEVPGGEMTVMLRSTLLHSRSIVTPAPLLPDRR